MALVFAATVTDRWFVRHRGLVTGVLTAARRHRPARLPARARPARARARAGGSAVADRRRRPRWPWCRSSGGCCATVPEDVGTTALGAEPDAPSRTAARSGTNAAGAGAHGAADRRRGPGRSGCSSAGFAICGASTNGLVGTHFIPAAHDHGMAEPAAAGLLAVVGIFDIVGHDRVRLAERQGRPADAARRLLRAARAVADGPAEPVRGHHRAQHAGLHRLLRARLGGDRAAHGGAVPAASTAATAPWCSAGCSARTRSAPRSPPSAPGSPATTSAPTTSPGTSPGAAVPPRRPHVASGRIDGMRRTGRPSASDRRDAGAMTRETPSWTSCRWWSGSSGRRRPSAPTPWRRPRWPC